MTAEIDLSTSTTRRCGDASKPEVGRSTQPMMQEVKTNEDGSLNLSDLHQLLDDMEYAGMIEYRRMCSDDEQARKRKRN